MRRTKLITDEAQEKIRNAIESMFNQANRLFADLPWESRVAFCRQKARDYVEDAVDQIRIQKNLDSDDVQTLRRTLFSVTAREFEKKFGALF